LPTVPKKLEPWNFGEDRVYLREFANNIDYYHTEIDRKYNKIGNKLFKYVNKKTRKMKKKLFRLLDQLIQECEYVIFLI